MRASRTSTVDIASAQDPRTETHAIGGKAEPVAVAGIWASPSPALSSGTLACAAPKTTQAAKRTPLPGHLRSQMLGYLGPCEIRGFEPGVRWLPSSSRSRTQCQTAKNSFWLEGSAPPVVRNTNRKFELRGALRSASSSIQTALGARQKTGVGLLAGNAPSRPASKSQPFPSFVSQTTLTLH